MHLIALILAAIFLFLACILMIKSLDIVANKSKKILISDKFQEQLGTLIEDYEIAGIFTKCFTFLFLLRRFCYSSILVVLIEYPHLQLFLCIGLLVFPVIINIYITIYIYIDGNVAFNY